MIIWKYRTTVIIYRRVILISKQTFSVVWGLRITRFFAIM